MADISRLVLEVDSSGVIHATGNLEKFSEAAERAEKASGGAEHQTASLDSVMGGLNMSSLAAAAGITSLVAAVGGLVNFGKQAIQTYSNFEQIQNSLGGVLKDAQKGKEMFEDLRKFSFDTTFGVDTLSEAASQLLNVGVAAQKIKPQLKMLGDIAGGDTLKFKELTSIFSKIQNTGKATSVQLQQLALRGVPIYQMLQEMGVQGTATADDITEAFERMTAAGGQFYNNMQSINETIAGKEGFISDTFRELLASFAEASGLAATYKTVLDLVYAGLQGIVNVLQAINANPVAKAVFQGVLVTALTALAVVIGTSLVTALTTVIAKMTAIAALQAVINPAKFAVGVGLAAGAILGLGVAMGSYTSSLESAGESIDKYAKAAENLKNTYSELNLEASSAAASLGIEKIAIDNEAVSINGLTLSYRELAEAKERARSSEFRSDQRELRREIASGGVQSLETDDLVRYSANREVELTAQLSQILDTMRSYQNEYGNAWEAYWNDAGLNERYKNIVQELEDIHSRNERINRAVEERNRAEERHLELLRLEKEANDAYAEGIKDIEEAYSRTNEGQEWAVKEQIQYYETLRDLKKKKITRERGGDATAPEILVNDGGMDAEHLHMIDVILDELNAKLDKGKKKTEEVKKEMLDWQKVLKSAFNFSDKDVEGPNFGFVASGAVALAEFDKRLDETKVKTNEFYVLLGERPDFNDSLSKEYDTAKNALKEIFDSGLWEENEATVQKLAARVRELGTELEKATADKYYEDTLKDLVAEERQIGQNTKALKIQQLVEEKKLTIEQATAIAIKEGSIAYLKQVDALHGEIDLLKVSQLERLEIQHIQEGMSELEAKDLAIMEKKVEKMKELADASYLSNKAEETWKTASENYNANGREDFDAGSYAKGKAGAAGLQMVQGSDVGNFIEGFQQGGIWGAIINTLINALVKIIGSLDEIDDLLNPVTKMLEVLKPLLQVIVSMSNDINNILIALGQMILKPIVSILTALLKPLQSLFSVISSWVGSFTDSVSSDFDSSLSITSDTIVEVNNELDDTLDRMKALNDQYKSLLVALDEQEQYYLQKKMEVNADAYNRDLSGRSVNDMILTPQGNFSTHPDDYIIATKNPSAMGGGGVNVSVVVNNTASDVATASVTSSRGDDGNEKLFITISKRIASDVADGRNGWDNALAARSARISGRRLS